MTARGRALPFAAGRYLVARLGRQHCGGRVSQL